MERRTLLLGGVVVTLFGRQTVQAHGFLDLGERTAVLVAEDPNPQYPFIPGDRPDLPRVLPNPDLVQRHGGKVMRGGARGKPSFAGPPVTPPGRAPDGAIPPDGVPDGALPPQEPLPGIVPITHVSGCPHLATSCWTQNDLRFKIFQSTESVPTGTPYRDQRVAMTDAAKSALFRGFNRWENAGAEINFFQTAYPNPADVWIWGSDSISGLSPPGFTTLAVTFPYNGRSCQVYSSQFCRATSIPLASVLDHLPTHEDVHTLATGDRPSEHFNLGCRANDYSDQALDIDPATGKQWTKISPHNRYVVQNCYGRRV